MKACLVCFKPTGHPTAHRCPACQKRWERGRGARHPQRQAYADPAYKALRAAMLVGGPACYLCGELGADTLDHVVPLARGGTNRPDNLRPAHRSCNARKHDRGG